MLLPFNLYTNWSEFPRGINHIQNSVHVKSTCSFKRMLRMLNVSACALNHPDSLTWMPQGMRYIVNIFTAKHAIPWEEWKKMWKHLLACVISSDTDTHSSCPTIDPHSTATGFSALGSSLRGQEVSHEEYKSDYQGMSVFKVIVLVGGTCVWLLQPWHYYHY